MALHKKIEAKKSQVSNIAVCYKDYLFSFKKPSQDGRTVKGYFAVFGNKDSDGDIIIKGAFSKSLTDRGPASSAGNKIAHLWQHDMSKPLGKITKLEEDDFGLYFECEYDDIQLANDALTQIKSGTLDKFSIGYRYIWDKMEYDTDQDAFICKELELYEGSLVTLAANDATYVVGIKSEAGIAEAMEGLNERIDTALKGIASEKQFTIRQLVKEAIALAQIKPLEDKKQALKDKQAAKSKKNPFAALAEL